MIIRPNLVAASFIYMEELAATLDSPIINNSVTIPAGIGKGIIKSIFFEEDFCLRYYNIEFNKDTEFNWCYEKDREEITFKLVFTIGSDAVSETIDPNNLVLNSTKLYSVDTVKPYVIPAHTQVKRIALLFTSSWLNKNFPDANIKLHEIIEFLILRNRPVIISQKMGDAFYKIIREVAEEMNQDRFPIIHIKKKPVIAEYIFG